VQLDAKPACRIGLKLKGFARASWMWRRKFGKPTEQSGISPRRILSIPISGVIGHVTDRRDGLRGLKQIPRVEQLLETVEGPDAPATGVHS